MLHSLIDIERLQAIGLTPRIVQQLLQLPALQGEPCVMRVIEVQRDGLTLHDGEGQHAARALPQLLHALRVQGESLAVGDWVLAEAFTQGEWWVHTRVPPVTQIARRLHDGRDPATRTVIVSNVDTALLVMGLDSDFSLRRLERYLALARLSGVPAVVVLTKAETCADVVSRLEAVRAILPPGTAALALNARHEHSRAALAEWLRAGQTLVLLGSSGAGKSTLTNTLVGHEAQRTGVTRRGDGRGDGRGRHTTTTRRLQRTPEGACIVDTPGLRTLRLDADEAALAAGFCDIAQLMTQCRFRNCRHDSEPGCAVRDSVAAQRLRSCQKLQREAQRDTLAALQRKRQPAQRKVRAYAARGRVLAKGAAEGA